MKKTVIALLIIVAFILGGIFAFYLQTQNFLATGLLSKLIQTPPLYLKVDKQFNSIIYYASDRKQSLNSNGKISYLNEYDAKKISYGFITVKIPNTHAVGEKITVDAIEKVTPLSAESFIEELKHQAKKRLYEELSG